MVSEVGSAGQLNDDWRRGGGGLLEIRHLGQLSVIVGSNLYFLRSRDQHRIIAARG